MSDRRSSVRAVDATDELRHAHDVLAEPYGEYLADALDRMPIERALIGLFCASVLEVGTQVVDVGCGTGRLEPFLAAHGLEPRGVDLSPGMIEVARREQPGFEFSVADLRRLPFADASQDGIVCWYSLMYLPPAGRPAAFAELARVVRPGGYLTTAYKAGGNELHRGGRTLDLGVEFDVYWMAPDEMARLLEDAGFTVVFWGGRPADPDEAQPQGYLLARRLAGSQSSAS